MTDYTIYIISPPGYIHSHCFDELAIGLIGGLRELGYTAKEARNPEDIEGRAIVLGAHLCPVFGMDITSDAIIYNTEVYGSGWTNDRYKALLDKHTVWDYAENNIPGAIHCGVGFHEDLMRIPKVEEDIDILFYGSINERRAVILQKLIDSGLDVKILPVGTYGAERDKWIARAKVVLNIHYYDNAPFEIVRCSYLMANKIPIITEHLIPIIPRLLEDDIEREACGEGGFQAFSRVRQSDYLRSALEATALMKGA